MTQIPFAKWWDIKWTSQVALVVKDPPPNAEDMRDMGSIPTSGTSPRSRHAAYSSILARRIPMGRGAWRATVHEVAKSWAGLKQLSMYTQDVKQ